MTDMMGGGGLAVTPSEAANAGAEEPVVDPAPPPTVNESKKPDVSLEWADMKISFRVIGGQESHNDFYEIFPNVDPSAPSARSLLMQSRLKRRTAAKDPTLSAYIGSASASASNSTSEANSIDKESNGGNDNGSTNGGNSSEASSTKNSSKPTKKCPICNRTFHKATYLKRHVLSHSSVKPYKCSICNWGFYQQTNLKRHMLTHNSPQNGGQGFQCIHCQAQFTTKAVLSIHMRDAHGEKLMTKKAAQQSQNRARNQQHRQRINQQQTQHHQKAGNSSMNSMCRCQICGKQFLTPANLNQHMMFHRANKTFKCTVCGSRFNQRANLNKHMIMAHGMGHPCPHCTVMFRSEADLNQHVANLHPEVESHDTRFEEEEEIPAPN